MFLGWPATDFNGGSTHVLKGRDVSRPTSLSKNLQNGYKSIGFHVLLSTRLLQSHTLFRANWLTQGKIAQLDKIRALTTEFPSLNLFKISMIRTKFEGGYLSRFPINAFGIVNQTATPSKVVPRALKSLCEPGELRNIEWEIFTGPGSASRSLTQSG